MDLWCKTDSYWEWCEITHVPSGNSCEHGWNKNIYNVVELNCTDFEGRFEYIGDRGSSVYKCGVRVKNFRKEDYGEWKCDVWSYYDGSNKWRNYASTTSKSFQVEEEKNATTIIRCVRMYKMQANVYCQNLQSIRYTISGKSRQTSRLRTPR